MPIYQIEHVMRIVIYKTGSARERLPELTARRGDFEHWIARGLGISDAEVHTVEVHNDAPLPDAHTVDAAIITGSAAMVTDNADWMVRAASHVRALVEREVPLLGICFGHQLLGAALSGEVGYNPRGREIGTIRVALQNAAANDLLLRGFDHLLTVQATHLQSVLRLPHTATVLAYNAHDPHHAVRFAPYAWGLQFHPEFDAEIMRGYLQARRDDIIAEGQDADALLAQTEESPHGETVLQRFLSIVKAKLHHIDGEQIPTPAGA